MDKSKYKVNAGNRKVLNISGTMAQVIAYDNGIFFVTTPDGLMQYSYSEMSEIYGARVACTIDGIRDVITARE